MKIYTLLIFLLGLATKVLSSSCKVPVANGIITSDTPEYYWRDYVGIIPNDAVKGGSDSTGSPTYIGKVYIRNIGLLPSIIYPGCKSAYATAGAHEISNEENIEILCAKNKRKLAWIATKHDETSLLTNCQLVDGGSEIGHNLYIGRALHDGKIVIGKVFSYPLPNSGLWIAYKEKPIRLTSYEILAYNCGNNYTYLEPEIEWRYAD